MHIAVSLISICELRSVGKSLISLGQGGTVTCNSGIEASAPSLMLLRKPAIVVNVTNNLVMYGTDSLHRRFIFLELNEGITTQTILYNYQTWSIRNMACKEWESQKDSYLRIEHMLFDDHVQNWPKGKEHIPQIVFRNALLLRSIHDLTY